MQTLMFLSVLNCWPRTTTFACQHSHQGPIYLTIKQVINFFFHTFFQQWYIQWLYKNNVQVYTFSGAMQSISKGQLWLKPVISICCHGLNETLFLVLWSCSPLHTLEDRYRTRLIWSRCVSLPSWPGLGSVCLQTRPDVTCRMMLTRPGHHLRIEWSCHQCGHLAVVRAQTQKSSCMRTVVVLTGDCFKCWCPVGIRSIQAMTIHGLLARSSRRSHGWL